MQYKKKNRIGNILKGAGLILVTAAVLLLVYNLWDGHRARESEEAILAEYLQENKKASELSLIHIQMCIRDRAAYRDAFKFGNSIDTCENGTDWVQKSNANKTLYKGADILKELGQTFTYDGTTVTSKNDGADQGNSSRIVTTELPGAGQYAAWAFKVNYAGELSGTYRVLETIPDGMELAYIRIKWVGGKQNFDAMSSKKRCV